MARQVLVAGTTLDGKWRVDGILGSGGMGAVYAATHERNGLAVAIKVLSPELAENETVKKRFFYEGYAANRVGHDGTVRVLDDGSTPEGLPYLVMERLEGETLDAYVERHGGRLPLDVVVPIVAKVLDVIAAAHARGIVHRDLKPENVFLTRDGGVKVLDFGLAHVKQQSVEARITVTGVPMGTPAFMPPEQALAKWDLVDARSDVYALGAMMWTLLTGRLVHEASTLPELLVKVSTQPAAPVSTVLPAIPAGLAAVIDGALAFRPEDRWRDASAMRQGLRGVELGLDPTVAEVASGKSSTRTSAAVSVVTARSYAPLGTGERPARPVRDTAAPVESRSDPGVRRRWPAFILLTASLAVVGVGSAVWLARRPPDGAPHGASEPFGPSADSSPAPAPAPTVAPAPLGSEPTTTTTTAAPTEVVAPAPSEAPSASVAKPRVPAVPPRPKSTHAPKPSSSRDVFRF